ncbi:MAG TPA: L-ribulose-5-phosphate 4-epimerase AraD [Bacteroidales bacterium]|nr:L-ribulose-5-phosphate 4-epimerase AraD [Bacteroidales bacterium]
MLEGLKQKVYEANLELIRHGLINFSWGNVSGIDRIQRLVVTKPVGIDYAAMRPEDMIIVDLDGRVIMGGENPSSDILIHLELYKHFTNIGSIVHTHSEWATTWAQAEKPIPALGSIHASLFNGEIPCTRALTNEELTQNFESNIAKTILESHNGIDPLCIPGTLVRNYGPFAWGRNPHAAVQHIQVLEEAAKIAFHTFQLGKKNSISQLLIDNFQNSHHKHI